MNCVRMNEDEFRQLRQHKEDHFFFSFFFWRSFLLTNGEIYTTGLTLGTPVSI
jgi:hypothetical protein